MNKHNVKELHSVSAGLQTSDGDGVNMTRLIGTHELSYVDPFLLLDAFGSDDANDYIGGFPSHPHRGFETVTYLLNGKMRHKDNAGNEGVIEAGGVQWMTAGKGIVHSEMPEQENGLLSGFQLWVNLPAASKMTEPKYQEFSANEIPVERWDNGTEIKVISGKTQQGTEGPVKNVYVNPLFLDVSLPLNRTFEQEMTFEENTLIYIIRGSVSIANNEQKISEKNIGILEQGSLLSVTSLEENARFLVISATPLNEPVARGGPFVMNTEEQVRQAFSDYRSNRF